jgi:2-octaprenylphenol hydroxylase
VWTDIAALRIGPFRKMQVWDASGWGQIHFDSAAIGEPLLGWIIENQIVQAALWQKLKRLQNVDLLYPQMLQSVAHQQESLQLSLTDGSRLETRLLVGADGAGSKVRELAGIRSSGWQYGQKAVVTTVTTEYPHQQTAWQRFLPAGPLAFLPLHDGRCSIVWSTLSEQADELLTLADADFADQLGAAFDWRLGKIIDIAGRAAFPLRLQHAQSYVRSRIALIGDAAHVVHPLAGQGANLGLLDAAALAEVVLTARNGRRDFGSLSTLRRYERWRKGDNLLMLAVLDGFKRLFGSSLPPLRLLRNTGLNLTDALEPVKNRIMRQAMGLTGDLPKLARASY